MSKNTTNKKKYNTDVISSLAKKYAVSQHFIRFAIREVRTSENAEKIKKEYKELNSQIEKILNPEHHV